MGEADKAKARAQQAGEGAVRNYISNFDLTEEYQSFATYWERFNYAKVVKQVDELFPKLNVVELRVKYLERVPQTPTEEAAEGEVDQDETLEEETSTQDVAEVCVVKASEPQPPPSQ